MTVTDPGRDVPLIAGDRTFVMYAGNRALREIERETGTSLLVLFSDEGMANLGIDTITKVVLGLLKRNHPELTIDDVDDIIDAAGYDAVTDAMSQAMDAAMPVATVGGQTSGKVPAPNGTGARS